MPTILHILEYVCIFIYICALQRRRIEAAEMKLLRPLAGYTLYDHKTNDIHTYTHMVTVIEISSSNHIAAVHIV